MHALTVISHQFGDAPAACFRFHVRFSGYGRHVPMPLLDQIYHIEDYLYVETINLRTRLTIRKWLAH